MVAKQAAKQAKKSSTEEKSQPVKLVRGLAVAYAITSIVFIAYAMLLTYTEMTEKHIAFVAIICTVISSAVAGFDSAKGVKSRGLLWGVAAGACYALILFIICIFAGEGPLLDSGKLTTLLLSLAGGGVGGIMGINIKK